MSQPTRTNRSRHRASGRKDVIIQIRATAETKSILNRAAGLRGQKLSEFMLDSARRQAEQTILDQRIFVLDPEAHETFLGMLDASERPSEELKNRARHKALDILKRAGVGREPMKGDEMPDVGRKR